MKKMMLMLAALAAGSTVGKMRVAYDSDLNRTFVTVPEPATLGLFMFFGSAVLAFRRLTR